MTKNQAKVAQPKILLPVSVSINTVKLLLVCKVVWPVAGSCSSKWSQSTKWARSLDNAAVSCTDPMIQSNGNSYKLQLIVQLYTSTTVCMSFVFVVRAGHTFTMNNVACFQIEKQGTLPRLPQVVYRPIGPWAINWKAGQPASRPTKQKTWRGLAEFSGNELMRVL